MSYHKDISFTFYNPLYTYQINLNLLFVVCGRRVKLRAKACFHEREYSFSVVSSATLCLLLVKTWIDSFLTFCKPKSSLSVMLLIRISFLSLLLYCIFVLLQINDALPKAQCLFIMYIYIRKRPVGQLIIKNCVLIIAKLHESLSVTMCPCFPHLSPRT